MKKIISNKVYDTTTAKRVGWWCNNLSSRDFNYCEESLYRKKTGEFFLHGEGHANSRYAQQCGSNSWGWGERIITLSYEAAQEWAEKRLDGDEYEEIFGEVVEDETRVSASFYVRKDTLEKIKRLSQEQGKTLGEIIDGFIHTDEKA